MMQERLILFLWYNAEREGGKKILEDTFILPRGIPVCMGKVIEKLRMSQVVKKR